MKKLLLSIAGCFAIGTFSFAQTTLYTEDFETGGGSFSLNTSDMGGASTYNTWLMNNNYTGGNGTFVCQGFPFSFTVANTQTQPGGITNSPTSTYLHISAQAAISSGINCASYIPADGTCVTAETNFSKMTGSISTLGYSNVGFDFWWMCGGSVDAYGEVYYSLDGGATWVLKQSTMNNVTNWAQMALTDVAWDNQASLQFGFRFVNNLTGAATDPGLCIDQLKIEGTLGGGGNTITTSGAILPASWCEGTAVTNQINFVSTGTFNAGNIYTAELSDATGSFAAPTAIGTLASTANSGMITGMVPGTMPAGSGYRIRVVSDNPATIGSDNGSDLEIFATPVVTQTAFSDVCTVDGAFTLTGGTPSGGTYSGTGVSGGMFDPGVAGAGTHTITYSYTDGNGCTGETDEDILVEVCGGISEEALAFQLFPNPTESTFELIVEAQMNSIALNDMSGRIVKSFDPTVSLFDVSEIPSGVYIVRIEVDGQFSQRRLVIR